MLNALSPPPFSLRAGSSFVSLGCGLPTSIEDLQEQGSSFFIFYELHEICGISAEPALVSRVSVVNHSSLTNVWNGQQMAANLQGCCPIES